MRNLVDILNEGFYQSVGAHDAVIRAKVFKLFDNGDLASYLKKLGCSKTSFVSGVFKYYLIKSLQSIRRDSILNGLVVGYSFNNQPLIYLDDSEYSLWREGGGDYKDKIVVSNVFDIEVTYTQEMSVISVAEIRKSSKHSRLTTLATSWILDSSNGVRDDQWIIYPYTDGSRCCSSDLEQVLEATSIDYKKVNLSRTGNSKTGEIFIVDNFINRFK